MWLKEDSMDLECRDWIELSRYLSVWQERLDSVSEESLTDFLLFQSSERFSFIKHHVFTKHEEARVYGADWEWWFIGDNSLNMKFRVQAKRLRSNKNNHYPSLAYSNDYGLQIEKLIDQSKADNAIPLYLYYAVHEHKTKCKLGELEKINGAFLDAALRVKERFIDSSGTKASMQEVMETSVPLSCLLCCPVSASGGVQGLSNFYEQYLHVETEGETQAMHGNRRLGYHENVPNYIHALVANWEETPEWYDEEFKRMLPPVKGVSVFDLRS